MATITHGIAASGSVMMVCPGTQLALSVLRERPEIPIGVHLALTRDLPAWEWSPLTTGASIQYDGLLARAQAKDVRAEFRAQIEAALAAGVEITHVDWHSLADGGREDFFKATLQLAQEHRVRIRTWTEFGRRHLRSHGYPTQARPFLDSFSMPPEGKLEYLLAAARDLPEGLTEWAMHPAGCEPGDPGTAVRCSDYRALMSPRLRQGLDENLIAVVGYGHGHMCPFRGLKPRVSMTGPSG